MGWLVHGGESFANTPEPCASAWSSPTILAPLRGRQDEDKKQGPAFADEVWVELFSVCDVYKTSTTPFLCGGTCHASILGTVESRTIRRTGNWDAAMTPSSEEHFVCQ